VFIFVGPLDDAVGLTVYVRGQQVVGRCWTQKGKQVFDRYEFVKCCCRVHFWESLRACGLCICVEDNKMVLLQWRWCLWI